MWGNTVKKSYWRRTGVRRAYIVAGVVLVLAAELHGRSQSLAGVSVEDRENVILFATALEAVREDYVDREATDPEKLTYAAISGTLDSLGD
jgi:hypothetical protein